MTFIAPTERKHWRTRLIVAGMYVLVVAGALTMVYPFLLMVSGSLKSEVDFEQFEIVPAYLFDDAVLFRKFEQSRYKSNAWRFQFSTVQDVELFENVQLPEAINLRRVSDLKAFLTEGDFPPDLLTPGQTIEGGAQPKVLRMFRNALARRFDGNLDALNRAMNTTFRNWDQISIPAVERISAKAVPPPSPLERFYVEEFRSTIELREFWPMNASGMWAYDLRTHHRRDINDLNRAWGTQYRSFFEIPLPRTCPQQPEQAKDWIRFVTEGLHPVHLRNPEVARPGGDPKAAIIDSFDFRYRDWLESRYKTIAQLNLAWATEYVSFASVPLNLLEYDAQLMREHRSDIVWEYLTRNYRQSFAYLALRGRAFWNTFIYCTLNVLLHMLINPLAAYALSRYQFRAAHWVLLFCVLTMAFPAEVGGIPRFLMLREMGLINTFWALVLPGAAHGFSIFILKGFFDGLAPELYEAAVIEGAPERWMFLNITMALTKPILAVTAFGAFTGAYGAFMFALITCPDERMWTISVWLYQYQQNVSEPVAFSALVLASLPVLGAFLLAQRFILQGIVLPTEK